MASSSSSGSLPYMGRLPAALSVGAPHGKVARREQGAHEPLGAYDPARDLAEDIVRLAGTLHIEEKRNSLLITVMKNDCSRAYRVVPFKDMPEAVRKWLECELKSKSADHVIRMGFDEYGWDGHGPNADFPKMYGLLGYALQSEKTTRTRNAWDSIMGPMNFDWFDGSAERTDALRNRMLEGEAPRRAADRRTHLYPQAEDLRDSVRDKMEAHLDRCVDRDQVIHLWTAEFFRPLQSFLRHEIKRFQSLPRDGYVDELPAVVGRFQVDVVMVDEGQE